jgi:hypothetical protein
MAMGRFATRFVGGLSEEDQTWLEDTWKHHAAHATRCRAHAILLSAKRRTVFELAVIFGVTEATVIRASDVWNLAVRFARADSLSRGRYWIKRCDIPAVDPDTSNEKPRLAPV